MPKRWPLNSTSAWLKRNPKVGSCDLSVSHEEWKVFNAIRPRGPHSYPRIFRHGNGIDLRVLQIAYCNCGNSRGSHQISSKLPILRTLLGEMTWVSDSHILQEHWQFLSWPFNHELTLTGMRFTTEDCRTKSDESDALAFLGHISSH